MGIRASEAFECIDAAQIRKSGGLQLFEKCVFIIAEPSVVGEKLIITSQDGHIEMYAVAKEGDWKVTNHSGKQYFISGEKLKERYAKIALGVFMTKKPCAPVLGIRVSNNVKFTDPLGGELVYINAGDYLVVDDTGFYSAQKAEFESMYRPVEE